MSITQLELIPEKKYELNEVDLKHCWSIQEKIEKHFKVTWRTSFYRIVAFHLKDKKKFIARIAGSFYFGELSEDRVKWQRSYHGKGDQLYKWISWVEGDNNMEVDLLLMWCPGSDLRENYERNKLYLERQKSNAQLN
ncbi:hypothetical protein SAMN05216389_1263 [Oceanobacillus limi]|uniref:Uncharacterized protein n=1 Tax=Oceanobacillus limi TaxID=930131 RepID=A0A1I0GYN8_9BACI|nr:hypothetical protein [Oceanobacillus limi]SET76388.1 hypothetical protein SAMN05216389_1263 [Oceanobacillus limi]